MDHQMSFSFCLLLIITLHVAQHTIVYYEDVASHTVCLEISHELIGRMKIVSDASR